MAPYDPNTQGKDNTRETLHISTKCIFPWNKTPINMNNVLAYQ